MFERMNVRENECSRESDNIVAGGFEIEVETFPSSKNSFLFLKTSRTLFISTFTFGESFRSVGMGWNF